MFVVVAGQMARHGTLLKARQGRASYRQSAFGKQQKESKKLADR
jgi:hypothetical protein